jgi:hypothetical protein
MAVVMESSVFCIIAPYSPLKIKLCATCSMLVFPPPILRRGHWIFFSILLNLSSHTMPLGSTQPLTEIIVRNLPRGRGKGRPALKPDNLTAIFEPIV